MAASPTLAANQGLKNESEKHGDKSPEIDSDDEDDDEDAAEGGDDKPQADPTRFKSPHGWALLTGRRATQNVIRVDSESRDSLQRVPSDLFQHALLWDGSGYQLQIPDEVREEFNAFQAAPSTVGNVRQKLVKETVTFSRCFAEEKVKPQPGPDSATPSEVLMRMTFWGADTFHRHSEQFLATFPEDVRGTLSNLFCNRLQCANSRYQLVRTLTMVGMFVLV